MKKLKYMLLKDIATPLLRRGGTLLAALLLSKGIPSEIVEQVTVAVLALSAVSLDLLMSKLSRN
jgi:hypothetical protein